MTKPESLPVEEARKKFADILDGTQFRSTHTEITRRGKAAGVVVPPEWYDEAVEALTEKRRRATASPPTATATPRQQVTQAIPDLPDLTGISAEVAALPYERIKQLARSAKAREPKWVEDIRQEHPDADEPRLNYLIVDTGFRQGRKPPGLADPPAVTGEAVVIERPASGEEKTG